MSGSLNSLYDSDNDLSFLHCREYVEGIIIGACASPEIPLPDAWLPWTIKYHQKVQNNAQADFIFTHLFDYFRDQLSLMKQNKMVLPEYVNADQLIQNTPMHNFFSGLVFAHQANEKAWQNAWNNMQQIEADLMVEHANKLKHCLMMFTTFAAPQQAIDRAINIGNQEFIEKLPQIAKSLPEAFNKYVSLAGELVEYLPEQFETFEQSRDS